MTMYFPKLRNGVSTMLVISSLGLCCFAKAGPVNTKRQCRIDDQDRWVSCTKEEIRQKLCKDGLDKQGNELLVPCAEGEDDVIVIKQVVEPNQEPPVGEENYVPTKDQAMVLNFLSVIKLDPCIQENDIHANCVCQGKAMHLNIVKMSLVKLDKDLTFDELKSLVQMTIAFASEQQKGLGETSEAMQRIENDFKLKIKEMRHKNRLAFLHAATGLAKVIFNVT